MIDATDVTEINITTLYLVVTDVGSIKEASFVAVSQTTEKKRK